MPLFTYRSLAVAYEDLQKPLSDQVDQLLARNEYKDNWKSGDEERIDLLFFH